MAKGKPMSGWARLWTVATVLWLGFLLIWGLGHYPEHIPAFEKWTCVDQWQTIGNEAATSDDECATPERSRLAWSEAVWREEQQTGDFWRLIAMGVALPFVLGIFMKLVMDVVLWVVRGFFPAPKPGSSDQSEQSGDSSNVSAAD